jgi:hypothetical protein
LLIATLPFLVVGARLNIYRGIDIGSYCRSNTPHGADRSMSGFCYSKPVTPVRRAVVDNPDCPLNDWISC